MKKNFDIDLGKLITKGTVYVECHMTVAKIKKMIAQAENRKAFFHDTGTKHMQSRPFFAIGRRDEDKIRDIFFKVIRL